MPHGQPFGYVSCISEYYFPCGGASKIKNTNLVDLGLHDNFVAAQSPSCTASGKS